MYQIHNKYRAYVYCLHKHSLIFIWLWHSLIKKIIEIKQTILIPVLRSLLEHSALTYIIFHLCDYSLGTYVCAQVIHKPDNLPMDK